MSDKTNEKTNRAASPELLSKNILVFLSPYHLTSVDLKWAERGKKC